MMNDCQNVAIREALPELVHGALSDAETMRVQEHLDACSDCAAELAIIRSVLRTAPAVPVNIASIAAAIPPYRRESKRFGGMRRVYMELAAACLIGAVGISAFAIHNSRTADPTIAPAATSLGGLAIVSTSDLTDDGLAQLTQDLDNLQAMPSADPESVTPVALEEIAPLGVVGDTQ